MLSRSLFFENKLYGIYGSLSAALLGANFLYHFADILDVVVGPVASGGAKDERYLEGVDKFEEFG